MGQIPERVLGERLYVGRTPDDLRVYVSVQMYQRDGGTTVEHAEIGPYEELSIWGAAYKGASGFRDSQHMTGGQCVDTVRSVAQGTPARGVDTADILRLVEIWDRWHLNGMKTRCAHQAAAGDTVSERLDGTPPCPETGYRYGSAWLVEPLPADVVAEIEQIVARLR